MPKKKTLILVRHAKSSWKDRAIDDSERPLSKRGSKDAPKMGKHLSRLEITPETIFSSPALRALATARLISEELDISPNDVEIMDKLYTFDFMQLLDVVNSLPKKLDYVMIVGHNPAMTDLTNYLSGSKIDNVPTCGVVVLKFPPTSWKKIDKNSAELRSFDYPKKLW